MLPLLRLFLDLVVPPVTLLRATLPLLLLPLRCMRALLGLPLPRQVRTQLLELRLPVV